MATLNLGCGTSPVQGATNHDVWKHHDYVNVAFDLEVLPWPVETASFNKIISLHVFEHLRPWKCEVRDWLDECYRILVPGGQLVMAMPPWNSESMWTNPTHHKPFAVHTFDFWDLSTHFGQNYGAWMWGEGYDKWWKIERAEDTGQLEFILRKI